VLIHFIFATFRPLSSKNDLKGKANKIIKKFRETLQNFHNMCVMKSNLITCDLLLFIYYQTHVIIKRM
jgi:hypothetical protein